MREMLSICESKNVSSTGVGHDLNSRLTPEPISAGLHVATCTKRASDDRSGPSIRPKPGRHSSRSTGSFRRGASSTPSFIIRLAWLGSFRRGASSTPSFIFRLPWLGSFRRPCLCCRRAFLGSEKSERESQVSKTLSTKQPERRAVSRSPVACYMIINLRDFLM